MKTVRFYTQLGTFTGWEKYDVKEERRYNYWTKISGHILFVAENGIIIEKRGEK